MCGLLGVVGVASSEFVRAAPEVLQHRGPDDFGWLTMNGVVATPRSAPATIDHRALLYHRRLSILDLTEAGRQPLATQDGRFHLVYNGEIYNYRELRIELEALGLTFRTNTDTEVLLHALAQWGEDALQRLVGMFAFVLLDSHERTVTLARDFFGIKPLYYARVADSIIFASEIKCLLQHPAVSRRVNPQRLFEYLRFGLTDHGNETLFADIAQLPPAHFAKFSLDDISSLRLQRYWSLPLQQERNVSFTQAAEELRELFLHNVKLHLRSDVPVGTALSGGIDSAAIVMAMRHLEPNLEIHAFSYVADDPRINEEEWIDLVGRQAGAVVHKVRPTPSDLGRDLDALTALQEEPFGSTSIYAQYRVFELAHTAGIKVMLDGQGADELFGGYPNFRGARLASMLRAGELLSASRFAVRAARLPGTRDPRFFLVAVGLLTPPRWQAAAGMIFGEPIVPRWLKGTWFRDRGVEFTVPRRRYGRDVLRERLHQTLTETNLPMLLRYEDRSSMHFSIESRVPFLTPQMATFVLSLPEAFLIDRDGTTKSVFRAAMRGIVPDAILNRRDKIGFSTPEQDWLVTLAPRVERDLSSPYAEKVPFDIRVLTKQWQQVRSGRGKFDTRFWRCLNLIRWAERFSVEFD
jgi:asparagine synthase (glutamine-hydrolysing)